ncbi:hypothetical protein [Enterococcus sp. 3C8_DIV0646]|uniref:hypothetical protein n=1 Tax=Enterococcus sp. 3C8_DIV0646 TaxID=1834175 RepID=UPI003F8D6BD0
MVPIRVDWERRLDKNNTQPMCDSCHTIKTKKETKNEQLILYKVCLLYTSRCV